MIFSFYLSPFLKKLTFQFCVIVYFQKLPNKVFVMSLCKQTKKYWNKLLTLSRQLSGTPEDLSRFFKFEMIRLNLVAVV